MNEPTIRPVATGDIDRLLEIEALSFSSDRLSRRSFKHWIEGKQSVFLVLERDGQVDGYGLVLLRKGTRLARLYSIALAPEGRGQGHADRLMRALEAAAVKKNRLFMRLEVAKHNQGAIQLYQRLGYQSFGEFLDYYDDHSDALRMQKQIRYPERWREESPVPWYRQTTAFTCGPACLMMVMAAIDSEVPLNQSLELDLWREATTIFMTSGHGGCHPLGLALAAHERGFHVEVSISQSDPIFLDGVRSDHKKEVLSFVNARFWERSKERQIPIFCKPLTVPEIESRLQQGEFVLVLISSYRLNGDKAPHWVVATACDSLCIYLHDPDTDLQKIREVDCQFIPVAKDEFAKMISYGRNRFSTALFLS